MLAHFVVPALLAASLAIPAEAEEANHTAYVIVDKSARASKALMKHRIAAAVEEVCGSYSTVESWQVPEVDSCRREAWASVNRQLAELPSSATVRIALRAR